MVKKMIEQQEKHIFLLYNNFRYISSFDYSNVSRETFEYIEKRMKNADIY